MKKLLISILILLIIAGAIFFVLQMDNNAKRYSSDTDPYAYFVKEQGNDILFILEEGNLEDAIWKAEEGEAYTIEDKSKGKQSRFLIHSESILPFPVSFSLFETGRDYAIYELEATFIADENGKLSFVSAKQIGYAQLAEGGQDTMLPYRISANTNGALLVSFSAAEHALKWNVTNDSSLSVVGPEIQDDGVYFYISGEAEGEIPITIQSDEAGLKLDLVILSDGALSVVSHTLSPFTPVAEDDSTAEEKDAFDNTYGTVSIPDGYHVVSYDMKDYIGNDENAESFLIGEITFQKDGVDKGELFDLTVSDEGTVETIISDLNVDAGTVSLEQRGSISITMYNFEDYFVAVWEYENRVYRLDYDHASAVTLSGLADMAEYITLGH